MADIDSAGTLAAALDVRSGEVWVIRPHAYVAAVLGRPAPGETARAACRALGDSSGGEPGRWTPAEPVGV